MTDTKEESIGRYMAIVASTPEKAAERAHDLVNGRVKDHDGRTIEVPRGLKLISLHQRSELYLLFGKFGMPFDIVPETTVEPWHQQLRSHVRAGRLRPVRDLKTRLITGEEHEVKWSHVADDEPITARPRASSDVEESELAAVQAS